MKRLVAFVAIAAVALVLVAMPAFAITGVNGTASNANTILRVKVGNTVVKLGHDLAESVNTSTLKATAQFLTGSVGDAQILGGAKRSATNASTSGSQNIGTGTKSVAGLASIKLSSGKISTSVAKSKINSAVNFVVGSVDALAGFTHIGTTSSTTDSSVGVNSSVVSRDVSIGKVSVLNLRDLLDQLGVDPLAMACAAVQSAGSALGVDTSAACATLTSVNNSITAMTGQVGTTETVLATLNVALAPLCAAAPAGTCTTVNGQIASLQSAIDNFQADPATACATMDQAIGTIASNGDTVLATLNGLSGGALPDLSAILAPVTSQLGALSSALATVDSTCNTLLGIVNGLLDTSLLSLDLIKVNMDLAAKSNPSSIAKGTIGALKVGNLTVVNANDLVALGSQLDSAINTVESALGTVFAATGLGLSAPSLDLLKVTTHKGRKSTGMYFADAAMTVAHLGVPSAVLNLPSSLPLGALGGLGSFAPAAVRLAAVTTPAVSVDAGVFSGSATFKAGAVLPVTGVADSGLMFAGMLTLIGAGLLRRVSKVF
jgi:hypothetical protein